MSAIVRAVAALLCAALLCMFGVPASAQSGSTTITGLVIDQKNALPVTGATVTLVKNGTTVETATTTANGRYTLSQIAPGLYTLTIRARGYDVSESNDLAVVGGSTTTINAALVLAATNSSGLSSIGSVSVAANQLAAATTISHEVSAEDLTRTGSIRIADQLASLPATNFSTSSSVGDDSSINLRGFGSDESASLLDGHPVGPLGVGSGGFNFSLGPAFGLSQIDVTYGSGAQGLYGSDTIGGAVDFVTINPTAKPQFSFQQQVGGFGIRSTGATATGTDGKLGYAFAAGRLGEYGDFSPTRITQSARPNNASSSSASPNGACVSMPDPTDPTGQSTIPVVGPCNTALNTYAVSQNTEQSVGLAKLTYALSGTTNVGVAAYDAVQWSDSTGNGDNDYMPYSTRLGQVQGGAGECTTSSGAPGYLVGIDPSTGSTACYTTQQYAAATSGPDGGGAGRQRSTSMRDYSAHLNTRLGANNITVSAFINNYVYWKDSSLAGGIDASGNLLGSPTFADFYNTKGYMVSDELVTAKNDFSFGYTTWHQLQTGIEDDNNGVVPHIPTAYFGEWSYFARDNYQFTNQLSAFVNAWFKHSSVSEKTTFDPRATLQYRPSHNDVVQFTYGRSDGAPSPSLKLTGAAPAADPGASLTSVSCNGFNDVTSAGNPNLESESANDFELGYGHRFAGDNNIQINGYVTTVANQLFSASEPLLQYGIGNVAFAPNALQTYLNRLQSQCPGENITMASLPQYLSVSTTYNAAHALARGVEITGRARANRIAYVDYGYYIESSTKTGISDEILLSNPNVVNGAQLAGIPLHQATVSLDVAPAPWEFRIDNYYTEFNNGLNRPSYWHSNAFISRALGKGTLLTLGGTNIFNNAVQYYGLIGYGTAAITNPVSGNTPAPSEEFGLAPAQLTLTLQQKF
ncbi:MAG TPA: TonB-dependent receptor [Candidatus Limnocylindria bacterium]|jgi:outer membrane receptor protein involved in Fe transport|nr:TonB-dependent receptor [Candidatus Limnocylindria bacterium]